jgi:acyl CoA:acetate/3-ketoacid CoA transferase alpha subunit
LRRKERELWRLRAWPIEPEEAVSAIGSGETVVRWFGLVGAPQTLIDALVESSDTDELTIISNYSGERIAAH